MKRNIKLFVITALTLIGLMSFILMHSKNEIQDIQVSESPEIENALRKIAENLDLATFKPIREGWAFDYGFRDGWILNKFEYIRSLLTYKDFQTIVKDAIYISGPHTVDKLDLKSKYSFGHYNPKFVTQLRKSILLLLSEKAFVKNTRPILEKYNILDFLRKHKTIYDITQKDRSEFERLKQNFIKAIDEKTWSEDAYRTELPGILNSDEYWNWSETSYYFWIRRDIDNTKEIWAEIITDVLNAYNY